jgi:formylglycine-generating enzyme required for sulfatase activity
MEARLKPHFSNAFAQARLGGSWGVNYAGLRRFMYDANHPMARLDHMGFRLVRDQEEPCNKTD